MMGKTVGGPDGLEERYCPFKGLGGGGSSPLGRGEGGLEPSKFFSLGKMQSVFKSPPKPLLMNHVNKYTYCLVFQWPKTLTLS